MKTCYADLHIHIGRTGSGRPVKITGARTLTIENILKEASDRKGMDIVGVIDCHVPEVLDDLERMAENGVVEPLADGGLRFSNAVLIPGVEIEVKDDRCQGPVHVLAYFPTLRDMRAFSSWLSRHVTNITLSTQRFFGDARTLQERVKSDGGLFIPAHVFTPFKSVYGSGVRRSLAEIFDTDLIDAIELGLSADTSMADQIEELHRYPFVSNSDAHSLAKIGREYQALCVDHPSFAELRSALLGEGGRAIEANYGLNPRLGKYHRTRCAVCLTPLVGEIKDQRCPHCGQRRIVKGVSERLQELADAAGSRRERPPYIHQVPLEFIPNVGPKTRDKLLAAFGTEMAVMHRASIAALEGVVGAKTAALIAAAREGRLAVEAGGAGRYGRVKT